MAQMLKVVPWLLATALAVLLALTWQESQRAAAQVQVLQQQNQALISEANAKLAEAAAKHQALAAEADAKFRRLADEANQRIEAASIPEAEVLLTFRKAFLSSGYVGIFTSLARRPIAVTAEIARPGSGQTTRLEMALDPNSKKELGEREGWAFVSGDTVTISQPDHKTLVLTTP